MRRLFVRGIQSLWNRVPVSSPVNYAFHICGTRNPIFETRFSIANQSKMTHLKDTSVLIIPFTKNGRFSKINHSDSTICLQKKQTFLSLDIRNWSAKERRIIVLTSQIRNMETLRQTHQFEFLCTVLWINNSSIFRCMRRNVHCEMFVISWRECSS